MEKKQIFKILIADDSLIMRKEISKTLKNEGHEVFAVKDGLETIDQIPNFQPDCLILDLLMPRMDGLEVLEHIKQNEIDLPVIVISADKQHSTHEKCKKLDIFRFLEKPLKKENLINTVKELFNTL